MQTVFSTDAIAPSARYAAWREAICDVYVQVEVQATDPAQYRGFIREAAFGEVALTDILLSEQTIRRGKGHVARLDKDCYYLQLPQRGAIELRQGAARHVSNGARGALFRAGEPYELRCKGEVRAAYLELPKAEFDTRFATAPDAAALDLTGGMGRILSDFCASLAMESARLTEPQRKALGSQVMDLLALALQAPLGDVPLAEGSVRAARLRRVQAWIEAHLSEADLSLARIAAANEISVRSLHLLFREGDLSVSDWIRQRRLQRAYAALARGPGATITSIAFDHGFNSSAHFATAFRRQFGLSPRDVQRGA